jgi:predicted NUDIX family NTP pyrophosphohydrolase
MAVKQSAGILMYRMNKKLPEVFLVHPGGPFWKHKDLGAWSIPKGEFTEHEDPLKAAIREFGEETGTTPDGDFSALGSVKMKSGKLISAWSVQGDIDPATVRSNTFPLEWPPRSGKTIMAEEVDRGEWFDPETAKQKINPAQAVLIDRLMKNLGIDG